MIMIYNVFCLMLFVEDTVTLITHHDYPALRLPQLNLVAYLHLDTGQYCCMVLTQYRSDLVNLFWFNVEPMSTTLNLHMAQELRLNSHSACNEHQGRLLVRVYDIK